MPYAPQIASPAMRAAHHVTREDYMTASGVEPTQAPGHHHSAEPADDDWLSTEALAAELGVTADCLTGWIEEGRDIPHLQLGEHRRFRRSQIQGLLRDARTAQAGAQ